MVVAVFGRAYNPRGLLEVRQALENVNKVEDLLPIMKVSKASGVSSMLRLLCLKYLEAALMLFDSHVGSVLPWKPCIVSSVLVCPVFPEAVQQQNQRWLHCQLQSAQLEGSGQRVRWLHHHHHWRQVLKEALTFRVAA